MYLAGCIRVFTALGKLMNDSDLVNARVMMATMQMEKIEIVGLEKAYGGEVGS